MAFSKLLNNFQENIPRSVSDPYVGEIEEDLRLKFFEQGYAAGWEDSISAPRSLDEGGNAVGREKSDSGAFLADARATLTELVLVDVLRRFLVQIQPNLKLDFLLSILSNLVTESLNEATESRIVIYVSESDFPEISRKLPHFLGELAGVEFDLQLMPGEAIINVGCENFYTNLNEIFEDFREELSKIMHKLCVNLVSEGRK